MKKCIGRWCLPGDLSVDEVLALLGETDCRAIEWALDEVGEISLESTDADIAIVAEKCRNAGMEVASVATGLLWKYALSDSDGAVRDKGCAIVRRAIDIAAILGADTVLVVPGSVTREVGYDMAWARATESLKALVPYAQEKRVCIGVENVWNRFLLSPREMREFIDGIGSPWVAAYFDAGNVMQYGIPEDWARTLAGRIRKVHVKGFSLNPGGYAGFVGLMDGDNDWGRLMEALREVGYEGHIISEVSPLPEGPLATALALSAQLEAILQS